MGRLQDKVCLVTGGARGMGAAEAKLFAEEGATVWIADVLDEQGEETAKEIGGTYHHLDVREQPEWQALVDAIVTRDGKLDVLINNAGIFQPGGAQDTSLDDFNHMMSINSTGVFLGMKIGGAAMIEKKSGSIVNISSVAGMRGFGGALAYGTSKWAVRGMTKCVANEYAPHGIRVNSIHPGLIETDMMHQLGGGNALQNMLNTVPIGRFAEAQEVARLALYLASDESSYSTGAEFVVDGGMVS